MSHIKGQKDSHLHHENGEHRGTAPTTNGRALATYERQIQAHLALHAAEGTKSETTLMPNFSDAAVNKPSGKPPSVTAGITKKPSTVTKKPSTVAKMELPSGYVWLTDVELQRGKLPDRVTSADIFTSETHAIIQGRLTRPDDAVMLGEVDGKTGKVKQKAL